MFSAPKLVLLCIACGFAVELLPHSTSAQSLELQAMCAAQAHGAAQPHAWHTDEYHYNVKMQRCFILEKLGDAQERLLEAFEKRMYAIYSAYSESEGRPIITCKLTPPNEPAEDCNSKDEFDAFVAKYLNE
jgi:hypothetical protein